MKQQRVYIDTSVIGGCFDEEFAPWSNGLMKDFRLGNFAPVVSEIVTAEIEAKAPEEVQEKYEWLLNLNTEQLEVDEAVIRIGERLSDARHTHREVLRRCATRCFGFRRRSRGACQLELPPHRALRQNSPV